jgi:hypothetical protein
MAEYELGDTVQGFGIGTGSRYEGTVVRVETFRCCARVLVTKVLSGDPKAGTASIGTYATLSNVTKVEQMKYVKNLVGPKPEPVEEPTHPTPWTSDGRNVLDANRNVVVRVQFGGYNLNSYREEQPMPVAFELARTIAEAMNEKHAPAKVADSASPF